MKSCKPFHNPSFTSTPDASHIPAVGTITMNSTPYTFSYDTNGNMTDGGTNRDVRELIGTSVSK